jgi:tRNA modification GTPase
MDNDTIAAIATPIGEGGISLIRISGPKAFEIADKIFEPDPKHARPSEVPTHTVHHGRIVDGKQIVDEVMLLALKSPRTYTMEDTVEITTHGGMLVTSRVLELILRQKARLAKPGEFTKRAFMNGRIDLTQAEAVADIIRARTDSALAAASAQLQGRLLDEINAIYEKLTGVLAHIEAHLDFPDEDLKPDDRQQILASLEQASRIVDKLVLTAREGKILREGIRTAIVGKPNVGKSSLLNLLLGHERAIVSETPGTTRDTIEEVANVSGIPLRIIDTAGIRSANEPVEEEGIRRSGKALDQAELVLLVVDGSEKLTKEDRELIERCRSRPFIVVINKTDIRQVVDKAYLGDLFSTAISAKTGAGLEDLKRTITSHIWQGKTHESYHEIFVNMRHHESLALCKHHLFETAKGLHQKRSFELIAADLRSACEALAEVTGRTIDEDVLDKIFSTFCIGK